MAEIDLDEDEARVLRTYATGPRIWDAAVVFRVVTRLEGKGLIAPVGDEGGAYALTVMGRRMVEQVAVGELAAELAARHRLSAGEARTAVDTYVGQLTDDPALFDEATGRLTRAGADLVREQVAAG